MEEIKNVTNPVENVVPDELVPGFVASEAVEKNEKSEATLTEERGEMPKEPCPSESSNGSGNGNDEKKDKENVSHFLLELVMLAAIIVLFVLHFCGSNKEAAMPVIPAGTPGNGDIVYVNIDTINAKYELVNLLTDSLEAEKQQKTVFFQNRQKTLETKLANYQRQMQAGQLTPQQAQYAEASLQTESQKLQDDYAAAMADFETRFSTALTQIDDSLQAATARVNKRHGASFIFKYGAGGPMLYGDPTKDITNEVLDELNKPFKKSKKK